MMDKPLAPTNRTSYGSTHHLVAARPTALFTLLLLAIVAGCDNGNRGSVTGTVTLDNKPLPNATVTFQPEKGSPSFGKTDAQGYYSMKFTPDKAGAEIGSHTVSISTFYIKSEGEERIPMPELVPAKYSGDAKLIREVKPGAQTINFDLNTDD